MARITAYRDDKDGTQLSAEEVVTIHFSIDNERYVLDLSAENAEDFRNQWKSWIDIASKDLQERKPGRAARGSRRSTNGASKNAAIRQWASQNGFQVSDRGPLRSEIVSAYNQAH